MGIIICGENGSGKSTLGRELAKEINYKLMDIEDYYFPKTNSNYKYDFSISKSEVIKLLEKDIKNNNDFILAAVTGNYGPTIISNVKLVIKIEVPKEIRLERVKQRSFNAFGNRISKGGDLYEKEQKFFEYVESKSKKEVNDWIDRLKCPIVKIDGTNSIYANIEILKNIIVDMKRVEQ